jgi:trans-2,3-dihydro-3-hydroxyanthranilate isomerase
MSTVKFAIVDVFSSTAYKGNPLAVVNDLAGTLSDTQMKLIARQFNLSETTFFSKTQRGQATYRLRSFLPDGREVFGVGHNILGAWWFLAEGGFLDFSTRSLLSKSGHVEVHTFYQELGDSVMPVQILRARGLGEEEVQYSVSIAQATPKTHGLHPDLTSLAKSVGLEAKDIGLPTTNQESHVSTFAPRVMSTASTFHLLVPVKSVSALDRVSIQRDKLLEQLSLADHRAYGIYLFTPHVSDNGESMPNAYRARFFSPGMSTEDPATGSAAGPLSAFLYDQGHFGNVGGETKMTVWQGQNVGRECAMQVKLSILGDSSDEKTIKVELVGDGVKISEGSMRIPDSSLSF